MKIPIKPLNNATYLAPLMPIEVLKITENGNPCFCEGLPIKLVKIQTKKEAIKQPIKTIKKFKL